ncbi:MAG: hypothetical protein QXU88_02335 [Candidatus Woesearchaeota archaeon]
MNKWVRGKTVAADTEFDAEERFYQLIIAAGGKGVPVWRTKGSRRKQLRGKWLGRSYHRRLLTETANSMIKRGTGETLRGRTGWTASKTLLCKMFHA